MFRFSVVAAVASYMAISISIVLVNKHLLGGRVPYPVAMTWAQMVVALPCFAAVYLVSRATGVPAQWPAPRIELRTALAVLPVSATFVAMVTLNNACLSRVEAAFYMVARSSHIFFSIVLTRVLLGRFCDTLRAKKKKKTKKKTILPKKKKKKKKKQKKKKKKPRPWFPPPCSLVLPSVLYLI
jgi:hypothetical protein